MTLEVVFAPPNLIPAGPRLGYETFRLFCGQHIAFRVFRQQRAFGLGPARSSAVQSDQDNKIALIRVIDEEMRRGGCPSALNLNFRGSVRLRPSRNEVVSPYIGVCLIGRDSLNQELTENQEFRTLRLKPRVLAASFFLGIGEAGSMSTLLNCRGHYKALYAVTSRDSIITRPTIEIPHTSVRTYITPKR
jgi:hypothetical protein